MLLLFIRITMPQTPEFPENGAGFYRAGGVKSTNHREGMEAISTITRGGSRYCSATLTLKKLIVRIRQLFRRV
jgi:hypothetical protein